MPTLLNLNVSPRGDYSISRQISAAVVDAWKAKNPGGRVIERDLTTSKMTFIDLDWIKGAFAPPANQNESHKQALALSDELIGELLSADVVVIGTPMYNFAIPALLKAWVDHVVRPGKTFNYINGSPTGYAGGRKVVIAVASSGVYDHSPVEGYLRQILGFIGIDELTFIPAGGTMAVTQGKVSPNDYLAPFLVQAKVSV